MSDIFWEQTRVNEWTWTPTVGYTAIVTKSLGDGTWSFRVNNAGSCDLPNADTAFGMAQEEMVARMKRELKVAIRIIAALSPIINLS